MAHDSTIKTEGASQPKRLVTALCPQSEQRAANCVSALAHFQRVDRAVIERRRRPVPSRTLGTASSSWSAQQARGERPCLVGDPAT